MRVIVPFTTLAPGVLDALDLAGWQWEAHDVSGSDEAYFDLLDGLWRAGEGFALVEHDVIVRPETIDQLESCPEPFCAFTLPYVGRTYAGLGCCRFSADVIRRSPWLFSAIAEKWDQDHPAKHWCTLDRWVQTLLFERLQVGQHLHGPALDHYRPKHAAPWPSHGCIMP